MTVRGVLRKLTYSKNASRHSGQAQRDPESSRALGALAEVNALDSRYALRAHSVRRGNDGSVMSMTAKSTLKSITVIAGKRQRDPESRQRALHPAEI